MTLTQSVRGTTQTHSTPVSDNISDVDAAAFGLTPAERELRLPRGATFLRKGGPTQTPVAYLDFTVDGRRLHEQLNTRDAEYLDYVGVIQRAWPIESAKAIERLLGEAPGDLPDGRVSLYVCPECGDLGCGAITACLVVEPEVVIWRALAYQTDYEAEAFPLSSELSDVRFTRTHYEAVLREELDEQRALSVGFEHPLDKERRLQRERRGGLIGRLLSRR